MFISRRSFYNHEVIRRSSLLAGNCRRGCSRSLYVLKSIHLQTRRSHYSDIFQYLTANGVKGAKYQNVRTNSNYNSPVTDLKSNDLRCNVGASTGGGNTTTVSIAAGSSVTFTADTAVYHQGPISFYMTKGTHPENEVCVFSSGVSVETLPPGYQAISWFFMIHSCSKRLDWALSCFALLNTAIDRRTRNHLTPQWYLHGV